MAPRRETIGVVGGGVNGIGTAWALLQAFPHLDVTVYSEYFTPNTTGDNAAGLWTPFITPGTSSEDMIKWSEATWNLFDSWWRDGKRGVFKAPTRKIARTELPALTGSHIPRDYRELDQEELKKFGPEYTSGHVYTAFIAEAGIFLPELMKSVTSLGGKFEQRSVRRLEDLGDKADVIVNCTGIGSYDLVPDYTVYPIRGQIMKVRAPWINSCTIDLSDETFSYIIKNENAVTLGGTRQVDDWRTTIDPEDTRKILTNCARLEPSLKKAELIREWAGLRPARRRGIRIEEDILYIPNKKVPVVHNYGHGGSGVTTFWGCSLDVTKLVGNILHRHYYPIESKL